MYYSGHGEIGPERLDPIDVSDPSWARRLPDTVGDAFEEWLDRFATDKSRLRDVLRSLAFAQGAGLPWETVWPALATSIAGRPYGNSDIEWALEAGGAPIIESLVNDRSVYRLFHERLGEQLRPPTREAAIHKTIGNTLHGEVARTNGTLNWQGAHPYIRTYLATHAAAGGILDELVKDPSFIIAAKPDRLLPALRSVTDATACVARRVYRRIVETLRRSAAAERASYLEMAARQAGADELADRVARQERTRPWSVRWARWQHSGEHFNVGRHDGRVQAVAVGEIDGQPIAVTGGNDGTDARLGPRHRQPARRATL